MSDIIKQALEWADNGLAVFPCARNKQPLTSEGHKNASTDPDTITKMFKEAGAAATLIGAAMGDGLFCVDVDLYKGEAVKAWYEQQRKDSVLTDTRAHTTPSGGLHMFYSGDMPSCKLMDGVDVKGEGGYVIVGGDPKYKVVETGLSDAPPALTDMIGSSVAQRRGTHMSQLEHSVLSGSDFHASLTQIAARLAANNKTNAEIQSHLIGLMEASAAANPKHERHDRWSKLIENRKSELTNIAVSAYNKFSDGSLDEETNELINSSNINIDEVETAAENFFYANDDADKIDVPTDTLPFKGYYAHEDLGVKDQNFVLYPMFAEDETVVVYAEPKTGKTAVMLSTALNIACGFDMGHLKCAEAGPTLYYALEGKRAIRLRVEAWKTKMKEKDQELPEQIPMFAIEGYVNFLDAQSRRHEVKKIVAANEYFISKGYAPLKAIYIDTLTRAMSGGDQNNVEDTSSLFDLVALLREAKITATIIFVHHKSRQGAVRGSTNIEAEPDMLVDIIKKGNVISARIARARSVEEGGTFMFSASGVELGTTKQGFKIEGVYVEPMTDTDPDDDIESGQDAELIAKRRAALTKGGERFITSQEILMLWFNAGLVQGRSARGVVSAPKPNSAAGKEALLTTIEVTGTISGSHVIMPEVAKDKTYLGVHIKHYS